MNTGGERDRYINRHVEKKEEPLGGHKRPGKETEEYFILRLIDSTSSCRRDAMLRQHGAK